MDAERTHFITFRVQIKAYGRLEHLKNSIALHLMRVLHHAFGDKIHVTYVYDTAHGVIPSPKYETVEFDPLADDGHHGANGPNIKFTPLA